MLDYVDLEAELSEEERMVRDIARKFVEAEVEPGRNRQHLLARAGIFSDTVMGIV